MSQGFFWLEYRDRVSGHSGRVFVHTGGYIRQTGVICA